MSHPPLLLRWFSKTLLQWYHQNPQRILPWKEAKNPYHIWLSEIILQQTRVAQGMPYYLKFINAYPSIQHLAAAKDEDVFKLWQGLGYYNRCRNLLETARKIVQENEGIFPNTYEGLLALKGIGPYSAAAIASFAFDQPTAVVDGNVYRVLSRFFGLELPIDGSAGKKHYAHLAQQLISKKEPAAYNQAIMNLGATICKPDLPLCSSCPLQKKCVASQKDLQQLLPVKAKKKALTKRYFHYALVTNTTGLWMQKRDDSDVWAGLFQPFLIERIDEKIPEAFIRNRNTLVSTHMQKLTHQQIYFFFYDTPLLKNNLPEGQGFFYDKESLEALPMPISIHRALLDLGYVRGY